MEKKKEILRHLFSYFPIPKNEFSSEPAMMEMITTTMMMTTFFDFDMWKFIRLLENFEHFTLNNYKKENFCPNSKFIAFYGWVWYSATSIPKFISSSTKFTYIWHLLRNWCIVSLPGTFLGDAWHPQVTNNTKNVFRLTVLAFSCGHDDVQNTVHPIKRIKDQQNSKSADWKSHHFIMNDFCWWIF